MASIFFSLWGPYDYLKIQGSIKKPKSLRAYLELFKIKSGGKGFCLKQHYSDHERRVPSIYLLALGELFIFKLKTHHYLGNAYLSNIWRESNSGNKAIFVN